MNKMSYVTLSLWLGMSFGGQAQTTQVQIAGTNYPVIFVDTNLSSTVKKRITSDLTFVFSSALSFEDATGGEGTKIEEGVYRPDQRTTMFPTDKEREGVLMVDRDNEKSVRVEKIASSNYLHAFVLMKTHSNAVKKASEFVALMNSPDLPTKPLQVLRSLFQDPPLIEAEDRSDEELLRFPAVVLQPYQRPGFSALHFSLQKCPELDGAEVLMMYLYMIEKPNPAPTGKNFGLPIFFYNGRWGFGKYW